LTGLSSAHVQRERSYHLGRHSTRPEQLHVNKIATEKNEVRVEGSSFSDDALEAISSEWEPV
jgi:hypothetical protein